MKKILVLFSILMVVCTLNVSVYGANPTLEEIADKFNNCSTVKELKAAGSSLEATSSSNKITVELKTESANEEFDFMLNGNVLTINLSGSQEMIFSGAIISNIMVDSIGQLHGYLDGEMFSTLNSEKITTYTLENEGFEIKELEKDSYEMKIDISKKIPLVDLSDVYVQVSDLELFKDMINGDGSVNLTRGNVALNKFGYDGTATVIIAERYDISANSFKSLLSVLEVMFDTKDAAEFLKSKVSSMTDISLNGLEIEVNPKLIEGEEEIFSEYTDCKFTKITIDMSKYSENFAKLGDINGDSKIDVNDAIMILKQITGKVKLSDSEFKRADVTKDAKVDVQDAILVLKYIVGKIKSF
ncbi:MAG: dockerin type I repeat-containing protein [Clostridia bacterium]|nr:dockerin type I repeat-containing protein [Clostridia bacterium]